MHLSTILTLSTAFLILVFPPTLGVNITYNATLDDGSIRIADTVCKNQTGLAGYETWGDLPTFSQDHGLVNLRLLEESPSTYYGGCIQLNYTFANGTSHIEYGIIVDTTIATNPQTSWELAHNITGLNQTDYPSTGVNMITTRVNVTNCGLSPQPDSPIFRRQATRINLSKRQEFDGGFARQSYFNKRMEKMKAIHGREDDGSGAPKNRERSDT
ncbi:hypothetical protein BDQ17DRAFT_1427857 [Cyathus striatus]|nr:hypothetical protein BDQ17DRAFT_1427857 [Cyathus striatus]